MTVVLSMLVGLVASYLALVVALVVVRPETARLTETLRLLPDLLRLVGRLARDPALPRGARVRLWMLLAYLAMPFDLIPDFIPVLGYADDVIIVGLVLRSVVRQAGPASVRRHWPGTEDGLRALARLTA
ncbi:MAG: hypothetical protein JWP53_2395 [Conexibacter sp.]|jgi:uncharacterized membrane protein YkvA (DUF1232 family)|nr:hypothetical protein [Conexibacter sp.]MDX6732002.1 hypothetical protein [Baekduia sp.]